MIVPMRLKRILYKEGTHRSNIAKCDKNGAWSNNKDADGVVVVLVKAPQHNRK